VVIAGGGLSGLAAGVACARRGIPLLLCEQRPYPGGRAYSFRDPRTGETIDNGQHLLIAGYGATLRFLETIGTRSLLRVQERPTITLHHPERGFRTLSLPPFPSPLHLAAGILTTGLVGPAGRLRILRGGMALLRGGETLAPELRGLTVAQWLERTGQTEETRRSLWDPLAIAIMNEHCDTASAELFVRSLHQAFVTDRRSAAFALPSVGLSELFARPAVADIRRHGGEVRLDCAVAQLLIQGDQVSGVRLEDGSTVETKRVILALPAHRVMPLLPGRAAAHPFFAPLTRIPSSPIISLHLWFDRDVMGTRDVVGLIGRRIQWVFNRRLIAPHNGNSPNIASCYLCAVISAAHEELKMSNDALLAGAMEDLRSVFGETPEPMATLVVREKRATFSSSPATELLRPGPVTPVGGLFLAGDWTATGLPATIEGAIQSGEKCADLAASG
jgi:squalene-associated FAD-dependent desaturase